MHRSTTVTVTATVTVTVTVTLTALVGDRYNRADGAAVQSEAACTRPAAPVCNHSDGGLPAQRVILDSRPATLLRGSPIFDNIQHTVRHFPLLRWLKRHRKSLIIAPTDHQWTALVLNVPPTCTIKEEHDEAGEFNSRIRDASLTLQAINQGMAQT